LDEEEDPDMMNDEENKVDIDFEFYDPNDN